MGHHKGLRNAAIHTPPNPADPGLRLDLCEDPNWKSDKTSSALSLGLFIAKLSSSNVLLTSLGIICTSGGKSR